jgi:hypothetical protein
MTYYHVSRSLLRTGDELHGYEPPRRLIAFLMSRYRLSLDHLETAIRTDMLVSELRGEALSEQFKVSLQEMLIEAERAENFPSRPSRIGSPQLFRTLEAARTFSHAYARLPGYIHVCEIAAGAPFDTYMDWVSGGSIGSMSIAEMIEGKRRYAAAYWRGDVPETPMYPEAILRGLVTIRSLAEIQYP